MAAKLKQIIRKSDRLDIAMAYIKIGGLRPILKIARTLIGNGAPIRIVFGLSSKLGITDKESAEELLRLSKKDNVIVKKWGDPGFILS